MVKILYHAVLGESVFQVFLGAERTQETNTLVKDF